MSRSKLTREQRRLLTVPLFDLAQVPTRRPENVRPGSPRRAGPVSRPISRELPWTPEAEARHRLAALLAEADAERAGRRPVARPPSSWEQLCLPGWERITRTQA